MMDYIHKCLGLEPDNTNRNIEKDDFSEFFYDAKSAKKVKIMREVMREATVEQEAVIKRYRKKQLA